MSRIRTTLDSVTKAVGSTDLISKFSRLKPGSSVADGAHAEKVLVRAERVASKEREAPLPPGAAVGDADGGKGGSEDDQKGEPVSENPFVATKNPEASAPVSSFNQTPQVYHPTNMDETYKTLAQHINSYFGMGTTQGGGGDCNPRPDSNIIPRKSPDRIPVLSPAAASESVDTPASSHPSVDLSPPEAKAPPDTPATESTTAAVPVLTASPKKGFTHYLSYPRPSVQAFVGNYIAPLVPKFRGDAQSVERDKLPAENGAEASVEKIESEDHVDESKQQLLAQREKIIARVSVDNRTRALVKGLHRVNDVQLLTSRVEELSCHLLEFPETRGVAVKEKAIPCLLRLRQATDLRLQAAVRESLALVGYTEPVKGRGIRVLAIDGGGTRGLLALQTLLKLENLTGKRVHQLFDYICGVSTGAILAFMLGIFQIPLEECEQMYRKLGSDVFKQNVIVGAVKMGWSHAFYDSEIWESILKERMGEGCMIESSRDPNCPKVSAVSTLVNRGLPLKAFVFRNYRLLPGVRSHYLGDCKYKMWQAIRASSAAPGYFQEYVLGKDLHQDGGLLINNPTALAIHECKCLWPNTPLQCVLSLGTGRHEVAGKNGTTYTSLKDKLTNVISSATDTEEVHTMLDALLPPDAYFRFNPYLSEDVPLNESRVDKLNFLMGEGERYLERNDAKLRKAAGVLSQEKGAIQRLAEWAKLKAEMYEGPPFTSKL